MTSEPTYCTHLIVKNFLLHLRFRTPSDSILNIKFLTSPFLPTSQAPLQKGQSFNISFQLSIYNYCFFLKSILQPKTLRMRQGILTPFLFSVLVLEAS